MRDFHPNAHVSKWDTEYNPILTVSPVCWGEMPKEIRSRLPINYNVTRESRFVFKK